MFNTASVFNGLGSISKKGITEKEIFWQQLTANPEYLPPQRYSLEDFNKIFTKEEPTSDLYSIRVPFLDKIYIHKKYLHRHLFQHPEIHYKFNLFVRTLQNPYIIFKSKDKNDESRIIFAKAFNVDGQNIICLLSGVDDDKEIKTAFKPGNAENYIYNLYKKGGCDVLYREPRSTNTGTINGVSETTTAFKLVEVRLPISLTKTNLKSLGKLPPMDSDTGNAFDIDWVPLSDIYTDEKNFQNRADKYSAKSVRSIINAVDNGSFNWFAFDPITLWRNPKNDKLYILSGHSRTQAFRELSKMQPEKEVDGLTFDYIPAKIFEGTFEQAKNLALNSNALGTPETLTERAEYYRAQREATDKGSWRDLKKKALRENNGQIIWDLSFLPADGVSMQALKSFKADGGQDSTENFLRLATICQWIGKAYQIYKGLSNAHDQELFKFLNGGGYGSRSGQYFSFTALNDRLEKLYKKNVADETKKNTRGQYTEPFQIAAYKKDDSQLDLLDEQKKEVQKAEKELKAKLKEMREGGAGKEQLFRIVTPLYNQWVNKQYDYWQNLDRIPRTDKRQQSIFGLGKADPYLYNNNSILKTGGLYPTYQILPSYDSFFGKADNKNSFAGFGLDDTKQLIADICRKHYKECAKIAAHLKADTLLQSCFNLWHWLHHNIRYEYDREGREEVRTPLRVWADRRRGVDCDCLSVFVWCVLTCMGYNPVFELVAFNGKKAFSHIFINCDGVVVDRVWFVFNQRPPMVTKRELYKVSLIDNLGKLF